MICFGMAFAASRMEFTRQLEWRTLDWRTEFRALFQPPVDPRLAVVLFEDSTDGIVAWPPDRAWHGNFNEMISLSHPAVVAWDVIFDASREGDGDARMGLGTQAAVARGTQVVVGASTVNDRPGTLPGPDGPTEPLTQIEGDASLIDGDDFATIPFPALRIMSLYGIVDAPKASDGIIREIPFVVRVGKKVYPSFSLQIVMSYLHVDPAKVQVRLGDAVYLPGKGRMLRVPITMNGHYFVNYRYKQADFPFHTYWEILNKSNDYFVEKKPGAWPPPDFTGKIVFVGQTVTGKADAGPTQLEPYAPLVLVHANVVANVLAGDFAYRIPETRLWQLALVCGYAVMWLLADRSVFLLSGGTVLGFVLYISLATWVWVWGNVWLPVVAPLTGFGILQFVVIDRRVMQEQRAKQQVKGMFGTYVSPQLVDQMVKSGERPKLGGHLAELTAYFSDIQGFSRISEQLAADRLVELMNEYLTACTDVLLEEGGSLDKYIGDAVVVMFGAPVALPDHAFRACVATQRVQRRIVELREKWQSEGGKWPASVKAMRARIGLNTGQCVVGNMGSSTRFNYTMMGDNVNLAARMESGAKSWGVYTMCTEATKLACGPRGIERLVFRPLGRITVMGRSQAVPIHEIVGLQESVADTTRECLELFALGLERYYARDWEGAGALFQRSAALEPNVPRRTPGMTSNPSLVYLDIVGNYKISPPPADWEGVYVMKGK
jgi:adenylate cyclase